jgi:hypothetical protein
VSLVLILDKALGIGTELWQNEIETHIRWVPGFSSY